MAHYLAANLPEELASTFGVELLLASELEQSGSACEMSSP
jgi:hypothetical protein